MIHVPKKISQGIWFHLCSIDGVGDSLMGILSGMGEVAREYRFHWDLFLSEPLSRIDAVRSDD